MGSQLSPQERAAKLNKRVTISVVCGAVMGLAGLAVGNQVFSPLVQALWGVLGGIFGSGVAALVVIIGVGLEKRLPLWWFAPLGLVGGAVGTVVLVWLAEWGYLFAFSISRLSN